MGIERAFSRQELEDEDTNRAPDMFTALENTTKHARTAVPASLSDLKQKGVPLAVYHVYQNKLSIH